MIVMPVRLKPRARGRHTAVLMLTFALAATAFGVWREHKISAQSQHIRMQDGFAQLQPQLGPLLSQRFETLQNWAKTTLQREHFSENGWNDFLTAAEWRSRYPGMKEIGYAEFSGDHCVVKFCDEFAATPHKPGFDLESDTVIRAALQKSADAGYGIGSKTILFGTNQVVIGLLNITAVDQRPASPAVNQANLRGFVFFALDQQEYFSWVKPQLKNLPFNVRLLAPGENAPPKTETQRPFGNSGGITGEWRFVATLNAAPTATAAQWVVLAGGLILSGLLYFLFATQARLRHTAELANEKILQRDAEITALNRDLEQKVAERTAQLNDALVEEKELNKLKSNFISMVTHEIRTPLALILGSSEILSRYLDRLAPEKRAEHLQTIDSAVQRMSGLLEDVLLFSKAEAGRMGFSPVQMDLNPFCATLVDELLSATNRRCPIGLACGINEAARADEKLLRHILSNLLTNAVKYSPPGTPVIFSVARDGGDAIFIVQDRGAGIPEEDRKRLFTPFYRGKNVATIQGTGLGLVIVKHCVERHGGKIEIASAENLGTTVSVRLPLFAPAHTEFINRLSQNKTA